MNERITGFINRNIITPVTGIVPLHYMLSKLNVDLLVPYYHMVSDDHVVHVANLYRYKNVKQFTRDVDFMSSRFVPCSIEEIQERVKSGIPFETPRFIFTFDDGFSEMFSVVAPILEKRGLSGIFFINRDFTDNVSLAYMQKKSLLIESFTNGRPGSANAEARKILTDTGCWYGDTLLSIRAINYSTREVLDDLADPAGVDYDHYLRTVQPYLTSEQIVSLAERGFSIGGHSIDHPYYADLNLQEQMSQTAGSMKFISRLVNQGVSSFAFPHSDTRVSKQFYETVKKKAGVDICFGTKGIIDDCVPGSIQRIGIEKMMRSPSFTIRMHLIRKVFRKIRKKDFIAR
jgi:peptidoglycan/xylan/chitin deacetylase (PgdA/CDA1 family)